MLIGNGTRLSSNPMRLMGGVQALNDMQINRVVPNAQKNQSTALGYLAATPSGCYPPYSWIMPRVAGALSSHNLTIIDIDGSGAGARGLGGDGSAQIDLSASAIGQLIAGAIGACSFSIDGSGSIVATVGAPGDAQITITAAAVTGALGWLVGGADLALAAALISFGIGWVQGTTEDVSALTPDAIAYAVWEAIAAEHNKAGSMGNKVNSAASAGDPWTTELPGLYTGSQAGALMGLLIGCIKNKKYLEKTGGAWYLIIRNATDTGNIIKKALKDKSGNDITDVAAGILATELESSV